MADQSVLDQLPGALARAESLPSPPTVAVEILRVTNDENASIESLAETISRDPVLAAKILKVANSSMFRRGDEVTTLENAAMRLGLKTVKLMSLSFSLTNDLPRKIETRDFDYYGYWSRSLTMAVAGRALARRIGNPNGEEAFLCGLLGRIGQLVMAQCIPADYQRVLDRSDGELPRASLEREELGWDFHQVGGALLRAWELPELISGTIAHWGDPSTAEEGSTVHGLSRIMQLADLVATVICDPQKGSAFQALQATAESCFGISEDELERFVVSLEKDVSEVASMLEVDVDHERYEDIVARARMEMVQISLGTAADLEQTSSRAEDLEKENLVLERKATTDPLTGVANRAQFDATLERLVKARRSGGSENALGLLMVDVDHFKRFNDTHGHQVGDEVLKLVAAALQAATRNTDIVARYGGEEFVVVIPNTTPELLEGIAERVRQKISESPLEHDGAELGVTASIGGACVDRVRAPSDGEALLALADACLYEAKEAGRDCVRCKPVEAI